MVKQVTRTYYAHDRVHGCGHMTHLHVRARNKRVAPDGYANPRKLKQLTWRIFTVVFRGHRQIHANLHGSRKVLQSTYKPADDYAVLDARAGLCTTLNREFGGSLLLPSPWNHVLFGAWTGHFWWQWQDSCIFEIKAPFSKISDLHKVGAWSLDFLY